MRYIVTLKGENLFANIEIDASDVEEAISGVRGISMYDRDAIKITDVSTLDEMEA